MSFTPAKDKDNVLVGAASLLMGATAGAALDIGYTRDGVSINKSGEFLEVQPDQTPNPILTQKTAETYTIVTNLLEITLDNIKKAWGESATVEDAGTKLSLGVTAEELTEWVLLFYGISPKNAAGQYGERKITFYRVVTMEYGEIAHTRGAESVIPVTFRALYSETESCIGLIEDTAAV